MQTFFCNFIPPSPTRTPSQFHNVAGMKNELIVTAFQKRFKNEAFPYVENSNCKCHAKKIEIGVREYSFDLIQIFVRKACNQLIVINSSTIVRQ